jgi:hypothetical protein
MLDYWGSTYVSRLLFGFGYVWWALYMAQL